MIEPKTQASITFQRVRVRLGMATQEQARREFIEAYIAEGMGPIEDARRLAQEIVATNKKVL